MTKWLAFSVVPALLLLSAPAQAVIPIPANAVTLKAAQAGTAAAQFTRDYNGYINESLNSALSGSILFQLTSVTNGGKTWNFSATITNTSHAPLTSARISGFGFSTDGTLSGVSAGSGTFQNGVFNNSRGLNVNQLSPNVQVCFTAGSNCTGGGGNGLRMGAPYPSTTQNFSLNFSLARTALTISNFIMRYQSISGGGFNGASGSGFGSVPSGIDPGGDPVPEPANWVMLIAGFGLVGAMARRHRQCAVA